jgi:hypothetical protein
VAQAKCDIEARQGKTLDESRDVTKLGVLGAQKFAPRRTSISVPRGCGDGVTGETSAPSTRISAPRSAPSARVAIRSRATEPIEGSASPRKPSERMAVRSSSEAILLVA